MTDFGNHHLNRLLASLPAGDLARLAPHLTPVPLILGESLFEPEQVIATVHFPLSGMVSVMSVMEDGTEIETAAIGREGAVGLIQGLGSGRVFWRAIVQLPGRALAIPAARLREAAEASPALREMAGRYAEALIMERLQLVACNALHPLEARFARWLLMCRDRADTDALPLTQAFLAAMLGVNRTTVTQAAQGFKAAGFIDYRRGILHVLDRAGLERASCECRGLIRRRTDLLVPPEPAL